MRHQIRQLLRALFRERLRAAILIAALLAFAWSTAAVSRAQSGQQCRDIGNITVCGDVMQASPDGHVFLEGNLKLGPRGKPPVVLVRNIADEHPDLGLGVLTTPSFVYDPADANPLRGTGVLQGELYFINDLVEEPLMGNLFLVADGETKFEKSRFHVDVQDGIIFIPADGVLTGGRRYERHEGIDMAFLERTSMLGLGTPQWSIIEAGIDLNEALFEALVPIELESLDKDEPVFARVKIDEGGIPKTTFEGFKARFAGMTAMFMDVQLLDPFEDARPNGALTGLASDGQSGLRIGAIEFRKADNPELPNLDPSDPGLVFKVEGVEYRDKKFQIRGTTPIRDWELGNAFRLTDQRLAIGFSQITKRYELTINSTMIFGAPDAAVSDTTRYPVALSVAAVQVGDQFSPSFRGTLGAAQPNLGLGPLRIKPRNVGLELNPSSNFFGLVADQVALQWNSQSGGESGPTLSGFRLGVDRDKNLVFRLGTGGEIELPELRTAALKGKLKGTIEAKDSVLTGILKGTLNVALPGNSGAAPTATLTLRSGKGVQRECAPGAAGCLAAYDLKLSAFDLKVAGFTLALTSPRGIEGGGFMADRAALRLPAGLGGGAGGEVRNIRVSGRGAISLDGGGMQLPPLKIGGYEFAEVKGFFAKTANDYEFRAGGVMPLPGISTGSSKQKIKADMTMRTRPDGSFLGMGVKLEFSTGGAGIPLGTTGMELVRIGGSFDTGSSATKIAVTMRAVSDTKIRGIPLFTVDGSAELQPRPFQLTANSRLSLLVFEVARASVGIGAGQGFNGGSGFYARAEIDMRVVKGQFEVRAGKITLSNGRSRVSVAMSATVEVGIKKHEFARYVPPFDFYLGRMDLRGGDFKVNGRDDALGLIGSVRRGFFSASFFVDFRSGSVRRVNADDYKLTGAAAIRQLAAHGVEGYSSGPMPLAELDALTGVGMPTLAAMARTAGDSSTLSARILAAETVPIQIGRSGTALFGIVYRAEPGRPAPTVSLLGPDGTTYNRNNTPLNSENPDVPATYIAGTSEQGDDQGILLAQAEPGTYLLTITNPPASYEQVSYMVNAPPTLSGVGFQCESARNDGNFLVTTNCAAAPGGQATPAGDGVRVSFRAADPDSPDANLYVGLVPVDGPDDTPDWSRMRLVESNIPLNNLGAYISTTQTPSGRYRVVAGISDGENQPVEVLSDLVVEVFDAQPPERVDSMVTESAPGAVLARWAPVGTQDLAGYELGFGPTNNPAAFTVRDLGPMGDDMLDEGMLSATIWGLGENEEIFVSVRAYDQDGNRGQWGATMRSSSWLLAPDGYAPLPGGFAHPDSTVGLIFATPMVAGTLNQRLELRDAQGQTVPGASIHLVDAGTGEVYGMRFHPAAPLEVGKVYEVLIRGGAAGVIAEDGRSMPDDYRWMFTVVERLADVTAFAVAPEPVVAEPASVEGGIPGRPSENGSDTPPNRWSLYLPLTVR